MINKVILIGNLGADPEMRQTQAGKPVCSLSVATSERWKGKDGQMNESCEWHKVVVWDKQAENCKEYLRKGSKVYIEGKLQTRKWQNKDGADQYTTEIIANNVQFLTPKGESSGQGGNQGGGQGGYAPRGGGASSMGEDIPF